MSSVVLHEVANRAVLSTLFQGDLTFPLKKEVLRFAQEAWGFAQVALKLPRNF